MHRLPSQKAIFRFRLAALFLWLQIVLCIAAFTTLIYAAIMKSGAILTVAILGFVATGFITALQLFFGHQTKCPLCVTPVLGNKNCSKNKRAKTFFGSYRLRVAYSILIHNHFRCPYCSEPTTLQVRSRSPRQPRRTR